MNIKGNPKVLVLILTYNQKEQTLECLACLKASSYSNYKIVVVDNGSCDNSSEEIKRLHPEVRLILLEDNTGCSGGRATGGEYFLNNSDAEFLFLLDNDAIVNHDTLEELIKVISQDRSLAAVGAHVYYYKQPQRFWYAGGSKINWIKGIFYDSGQKEIDHGQYNKIRDVDTIIGCASLFRKDAMKKVGNFDKHYFYGNEESDLSIRMKKAGFRIVTAPKAKIFHNPSSCLGLESANYYYYRTRSRLRFMWENAPRFSLPIFFLYFIYDFTYNVLLTLYLSGKYKQMQAALLGVFDFFRGVTGKKALI